jgi:hypothetical protein
MIVSGRKVPYRTKTDLKTKKIVSVPTYSRVADKLIVKHEVVASGIEPH